MSVVDAHADNRTLGADAAFRAATRWQPREVVGQLYVAGALAKSVFGETKAAVEREPDPETRAFLPHLSAEPGPVTLAAVSEADGPLHELRLPVSLLSMFAAMGAVEGKLAPVRRGEAQAVAALRAVHEGQTVFKQTQNRNRFGSLEELAANSLVYQGLFEIDGYKVEQTVAGDRFEVTATPTDYPHKGRRSFFIDQTGVLRGGDKSGRPASAADEPVNN